MSVFISFVSSIISRTSCSNKLIEPLELRRLKNDLVMYFKCLNNLVALPSVEYFCQNLQVSQTSSGGNRLIVPLCSTNHFKNDFLIVVLIATIIYLHML